MGLAQKQYKAILKAYLTTADLRLILGFAGTKCCEIMRELHDYVRSLGKRPINRLISSTTFLEYYSMTMDEFRVRAEAEAALCG